MCSGSFTAKSRNNPKSQLNTPGPRRLLKPLLPREPLRQDPGLLGSYVSPKAKGSYQKPDVLPIFFGFPNELLIGGELPGQAILRRRSEEHTSELQSQSNLVCRLLLVKKKLSDIKLIKTSKPRYHKIIGFDIRKSIRDKEIVADSCNS